MCAYACTPWRLHTPNPTHCLVSSLVRTASISSVFLHPFAIRSSPSSYRTYRIARQARQPTRTLDRSAQNQAPFGSRCQQLLAGCRATSLTWRLHDQVFLVARDNGSFRLEMWPLSGLPPGHQRPGPSQLEIDRAGLACALLWASLQLCVEFLLTRVNCDI